MECINRLIDEKIDEITRVFNAVNIIGPNDKAPLDKEHPGVTFREPDYLIVICANALISYVIDNGVIVMPFGCLKN